MALWDIAGKRAGMPVYDLLGGRLRGAVPVYVHASGADFAETIDQAARFVEEGYRHVRLQTGQLGAGTYGAPGRLGGYPGAPNPDGWDVNAYLRQTPKLFAAARERLGDDVELLHDVHSRLTPKQAVVLARALEPFGLFFLEDPIAPEHYSRLPEVRAAAPVPLAVGELVSSVPEAARLVIGGGVDLLRLHISAVGGLTPGWKLANLCELSGVQTAWHAPADVSPIGCAANLALDVASPAFGIQEGARISAAGARDLPGYAGDRGRIRDALDGTGLGHRDRRAAGRETSPGVRRIRTLGDHRSPPGRCGRAAVSWRSAVIGGTIGG